MTESQTPAPRTLTLPTTPGEHDGDEDEDLYSIKTRFEDKTEPGDIPDENDTTDGVTITTPCIEWTADTRAGYGRFWAQEQLHTAHRVAYQLYVGAIPDDKPVIHHDCSNTRCVNTDHLRPVTGNENTQLAWDDGDLELPPPEARERGGAIGGMQTNTIDTETAAEIRDTYEETDATYTDLADEHDISKSTIGRIIRRERRIDNEESEGGQ